MGNPPFVGARLMEQRQKDDLLEVFGKHWENIGNMDYVCGWYKKAFEIAKGSDTKCALVSTNSITQGEQPCNLWKPLFADGLRIDFAWRTFRWDSESTAKAHVHCVIVGFSHKDANSGTKFIFNENGERTEAKNINGYLHDMPNVFVESRKKPLCAVSEMVFGSMANDGKNLLIEADEYDDFIKHDPASKKYIKAFVGAEEFINDKKRWCLWLVDASPAELRRMPLVMQRIGAVKKLRESSSRSATRKLAETSWLFGEIRQPESGNYLLVPRVSSENRRYVPIGFMSSDTIASDATLIVPNATLYHFGVLTSLVHMAWMRAVAGRLESRYRYSKEIVYNNFPWCAPTDAQKAKIEQTAQAILDARAKYPDSSLADLYDEASMPPDLRKAHAANDKAVMAAYGFAPKLTEAEIVAELFKMYEILAK